MKNPAQDPPSLLRRGQEELFRRLVDSVRDYAIFMLTPEGTIASWNAGAQRLKGYAAREAIGRHFSMFYPAEAIAAGWPDEELRRARVYGRLEDEGWRLRKDGTRFWANVIITPVRDATGELLGFSKVTRDLTERRRQEQLVRDSEEKLRLVVEGVRDHAMFLLGADGSIASWNHGAERVLGHDESDVLGVPVASLYTDEDRAAGKPQAELLSARHSGFFEADGWRLRGDGTRFWAHLTLTALEGPQGEPRGYVQIVRDLSERLRMRELEDEGQRIHEFIAMLSHELRNPLAPIASTVELLKKASASDEVDRYAELIGRQAEHLRRLVEDLLDVSRVTNGRIRIVSAPLELNTLVQLAAEAARPGIEALGHRLELHLPAASIFVDGDATRLTQVVSNLLSNAAKYTPRGGLIDVALARDGGVATLQVTDSGMGMSDALMRRAFDPFVQGSRGLDRSGGGLGIGLTLVRRIVELHGGTAAVSSAGAGLGTRFTVTLPLTQTPAAGAPTAQKRPAAPMVARRQRILVVDDNRDAADSLAELLRLTGHEVSLAHDGEQALQVAEGLRPDAILLDLGLPGMDGYEVARRMRASPALARTRLIALTGYGQASDRRATADAGFEAHLVKPVDFAALEQLLA
jgi:PAS domain S-box-containing protein